MSVTAFNILFVCAANICRSPAAAAVLAARLAGPIQAGLYDVRSAGVRAEAGLATCATMTHLIAEHGADRAMLRGHRSVQLEARALDWADLILTAERSQRAEIIQIDPSLRNHTFTVREGCRLVGVLRQASEQSMIGLGIDDPNGLIQRMNDARGEAAVGDRGGVVHRVPRWRRPPPHPDDILDSHLWGNAPHVDTARLLLDSVVALTVSTRSVPA